MKVLYVSYDCGGSYQRFCEAETLEELQPHMDKFDEEWLRWYIKDEGEIDRTAICNIHKSIVETMHKLNS